MTRSLIARLLPLAFVATGFLAPAAAGAGSASASCTLNCSIYVADYVVTISCAGSSGAYTSCTFYHHCRAEARGVSATGSLSCAHAAAPAPCSTGIGQFCSVQTDGFVTVLSLSCAGFDARGTVSSPLGATTASTPPTTVCVDRFGAHYQ